MLQPPEHNTHRSLDEKRTLRVVEALHLGPLPTVELMEEAAVTYTWLMGKGSPSFDGTIVYKDGKWWLAS